MAIRISGAPPPTGRISSEVRPVVSSKLGFLIKTIAQVAFSIFFVVGTTYLMAAILPLKLRSVVLILTACGASFLSAFFFLPKKEAAPQQVKLFPPNGIEGGVNNCWVHSILQQLRNVSPISQWLVNESPLKTFYRSYENPPSSQPVREILAKLNSEIQPHGTQEDVFEGIVPFLDLLPDQFKVQQQERTYYEEGPVVDNLTPLQAPMINLEIHKENPRLEEMLEHYSSEECTDPKKVDINGQMCTPKRKEIRFLHAPLFLFIQLKRFNYDRASNTTTKHEANVEIPLPLTITPVEGPPCTYRLKSTIYHAGPTVKSGHYMEFERGEDGRDYCCNDASVIQKNLKDWPLSQMYLLHYEKVLDQPN